MGAQYDEVLARLEAHEGTPSLLLLRGGWLREMTGGEFALPEPGCELPPEALISAAELKALFTPHGSRGGYRQASLPFLTITQFWTAEHPDPDEDVLRGVIAVLQERWEDFLHRDVGRPSATNIPACVHARTPPHIPGGALARARRAPR